MTMEKMSPKEKARERARLLIAWADGKTLQHLNGGVLEDWDCDESPCIAFPQQWRIKPEPRRMWEIRGTSAGGMKWSSSTFSEEKATEWKAEGWIVTEWQEVLP